MEIAGERALRVTRTDKYSDLVEEGKKESGLQVRSPMAGTVVKVFAKEGDTVEIGDNLCAIESMKMEVRDN